MPETKKMNPVTTFLMDHALTIMLIGFSLFFICFLMVMFSGRYADFMLNRIGTTGAIAGFAIYITGRVCMFISKKRKKQTTEHDNGDEL
jgi:hypothetical protein